MLEAYSPPVKSLRYFNLFRLANSVRDIQLERKMEEVSVENL